MPRPIKKIISKPKTKPEDEVKSLVSSFKSFYGKRKQTVNMAVLGALLVVLLAGGILFYVTGRTSDASKLFNDGYNKYYSLNDKTPLIDKDRYEAALDSFVKSYESRNTPIALFYIAAAREKLGQNDEAIENLRELVARFPDDQRFIPLAYYKIATIYEKLGRKDEEMAALEKFEKTKSDSLKDLALLDMAHILEKQGKVEEANLKYRAIRDDFPGSPYMDEVINKIGKLDEPEENAPEGTKQPAAGTSEPAKESPAEKAPEAGPK